jgi:PAS domain S-box-containing protein
MARPRFGIRMRSTVAAVLALALTALAFGVALVATTRSQSDSDELAGRLVPASIAADDLLSMLTAQQNRLRDAVTEGRAGGLALADAAGASARKAGAQVGQHASGDPPITARLGAVTAAHQAWLDQVADPQAAALRQGDVAAARALQADTAHVSPYVFAVRTTGLALQSQITGEQLAVSASLDRAHDTLLGALIAMIVVAAAITAEVIVGVWRGVLKPFGQLNEAVAAVAGGRYGHAIPTVGPAELAGLSRGIELMRVRLVAALAERERAEENLRSLFDLAPDAVIGVAPSGSIVMANAQAVRTFGYSGHELVGRKAETLVPEERRAAVVAGTARYFADEWSGAQWNGATTFGLRRDGTTFPGEVRLSRLPTDEGTLLIVAIRDITDRVAVEAERERLRAAAEQERAQRRLRQSQRLESLGQLVGGVAHDFNNLLGVISGYADFTAEQLRSLAAEDTRLAPVLEDVEQVRAAAEQAIRVTRQLLAFAKSEPANREVLDLNEVVEGAGQLLRRSLGERTELDIAAGAGLWPVEADRGQLEQVLMNLALNARDAMPDGGRLTITTSNAEVDADYAEQRASLRPGRYCRLAVADTGTGMDQATIDRVFEPFFSTKPRGRGTGLGLATVYGIVSGLGGTIDIYSHQGIGTTMNVLLPVSGQAAAAVPRPGLPAEETRGHGEAILLVEDEESLRTMAGRILARNGYLVREAAGGAEAIRLAGDAAGHVDLLVTDMVMPGMLGDEVADRIRAVRPGLPVLYMTGYAQQVLAFRGIAAPDLDVVQKPFTETVLLTRVRRALDRARRPATA